MKSVIFTWYDENIVLFLENTMREVTTLHQGIFALGLIFFVATATLSNKMIVGHNEGMHTNPLLTNTEQNRPVHAGISTEHERRIVSNATAMKTPHSNYVYPLLHYADVNLSTEHHSDVLRACHDVIPDVKKAQYHQNWCHIVIVNTAFSEMLDNWLCSAKRVKLWDMLNSTVFIGLDRSMVSDLKKRGLKHVALWSNEGFATPLRFKTTQYFQLMSRRMHLLNDLLLAGVHVFVSEVDQVLFKDPMKAVENITQQQDFDMVVLQDHLYQKLPCFGFMGIRPTFNTITTWRRIMDRMNAQNANEQLIFQVLQKTSKFKIKTIWLPLDQFWNGQQLKKSRRPFPSSLTVVHANWVAGLQDKEKLLRGKDLWNPTCNNTF